MAGHLQGVPDLTMLPLSERDVVARALAVDAPKEMRFQYSAEIGAALAAPNL